MWQRRDKSREELWRGRDGGLAPRPLFFVTAHSKDVTVNLRILENPALEASISVNGAPSQGRWNTVLLLRGMKAKGLTPILNVSDMAASFAWFETWGWRKLWDWGTPPTFGAVGSGECEIFLCHGGQGGRGKGTNTTTFQVEDDEAADKGAWMSVWVDDVDAVHRECIAAGLDVTFTPTNMPWNVREMHLRHPDGHVFRVSKGIESPE